MALAAGAALFAGSYLVAAATAPSLGSAQPFAVLAGTTVTNTGPTTITGNLGVSPGSAITGQSSITLIGETHAADAVALEAQAGNTAAFTALDQVCDVTYPGVGQDLVGLTLVPGVYCASAFTLTGTLTLSGSGPYIFKSEATLITSGTANVVSGDPCNVWWRVVSSATLGVNTSLIGNVLALTSISLATGANLNGRALAQSGAVTMDSNTISNAVCAAAPGPTASPAPTASAVPTVPPTSTDAPPSQGGSSPLFLLLVASIVVMIGILALDFGRRSYRRRAQ
jgi:type VI secretion system secreted protein VgrG